MPKELRFDEKARTALRNGADQVANAVKVTLGPKGRNVALGRSFGAPVITNDGVTVARDIELPNSFENIGAQLVKEAASKTNDVAGDGTTTSTVLAQSMINTGLRAVAADMNAMLIKRGMAQALAAADATIAKQARKVRDQQQMDWVATISSGDPQIGTKIAQALDGVGKDGAVSVEEGATNTLELSMVDGMKLDRGYISPYLVSDNRTMSSELSNPWILVTDMTLHNAQDLLPLLEQIAQSGRKDLLVVADDVSGDMLATLVVNRVRGTINTAAIKAPAYGERRKAILEDIAVLTKAQLISKDLGRDWKDVTTAALGTARRVVVKREETTIVEGAGSKRSVQERLQQIRVQIDATDSSYDREKLQERAASLVGGVAVLRVGAPTEVELKEKKHRVEDALSATQAAVEEGIVPGAGTAFIRAIPAVDAVIKKLRGDAAVGARIVRDSLTVPLWQIAFNAGKTGDLIVERVSRASGSSGYDVNADEILDLTEAGVVDPVKVVRAALQNAGSAAMMLLSTETLIADKPEKKGAIPAAPPDMMGGNPMGMGGGMGGMGGGMGEMGGMGGMGGF